METLADINVAFPVIFIIVALVLGVIIAKTGIFTRNRDETNDPRRGVKPNDTNYNMNTFDKDKIDSMSQADAKRFIEQVRKGDLSSLSPRDFAALKEKAGE